MSHQMPKRLIIAIALMQGILLTLLFQSLEHNAWPSNDPLWLISLTTLSISLPTLTLLLITTSNIQTLCKFLLPFVLLLSLLGAYVGYQQKPIDLLDNDSVVTLFIFTALIAAFKVLVYIQQYQDNKELNYASLFKLSWRNFIIFSLSWLFVLIFWAILHLGAGLFSIIKIKFFKSLLDEDWFVIPVINVAFGFAIIIFRNMTKTVDNISILLQTLIKFLLPALTVISLGFLATLPFTGLDTLWNTGTGSLLIMWLQALTLFFINSVYQKTLHEQPYKKWLHTLICIGVVALPIYSLISFYGLWLRIEQYGLSVERCWALLICTLLACFSVSYCAALLKNGKHWLTIVSKVNIVMGLVVVAFMLLVNSPLVNFQAISASNQLSRLHSGELTYETFDYHYFKYSLGRQGYLALQELKLELKEDYPSKVTMIDKMYRKNKQGDHIQLTIDDFNQIVTYWPNKEHFPEELIQAVYQRKAKHGKETDRSYYFIAQDLNGDKMLDYVVIEENNYTTFATLWILNDLQWSTKQMKTINPSGNHVIKHAMRNNQVEVVEPQWKQLKVGGVRFEMNAN